MNMNVQQIKQYEERLLNLYREISILEQDVKAIVDEVKDSGLDIDLSLLKKVAKLKANDKLGQELEKTERFIELSEMLD